MFDPEIRVAGDRVSDMIDLISQSVSDVGVADHLPESWEAGVDPPRIVVEGDGTPSSSEAHTVQMVRVRVHARDRPTAYNMMDHLDALLLAHSKIGVGFRISPGQNLLVTRDNKVGGYIAGAGYSVTANRKRRAL